METPSSDDNNDFFKSKTLQEGICLREDCVWSGASQGAQGSKYYSRLAAQHSSLSSIREPLMCIPAIILQRWFFYIFPLKYNPCLLKKRLTFKTIRNRSLLQSQVFSLKKPKKNIYVYFILPVPELEVGYFLPRRSSHL